MRSEWWSWFFEFFKFKGIFMDPYNTLIMLHSHEYHIALNWLFLKSVLYCFVSLIFNIYSLYFCTISYCTLNIVAWHTVILCFFFFLLLFFFNLLSSFFDGIVSTNFNANIPWCSPVCADLQTGHGIFKMAIVTMDSTKIRKKIKILNPSL